MLDNIFPKGNNYLPMDTLSEWLQEQMDERGWDQAELARQSKVKPASLSRVMTGRRGLGPRMGGKIAKALNVDENIVFEKAGIMVSKTPGDPGESELKNIYHALNHSNRGDLIDYARLKMDQQEREKSKSGKRNGVT